MGAKTDYFSLFEDMARYACRAAEMLEKTLGAFDRDSIQAKLAEMHEVEHMADTTKHKIMEHLMHDFITPIDREDIVLLANYLDDVVDGIEDVLQDLYMFNVAEVRKHAVTFSEIVTGSCTLMLSAFSELKNYKKSSKLKQDVIEINQLEEEGDRLYVNSIRELYTTECDARETLAWYQILRHLEACCDTCEHVADVILEVVMKNS